MDGGADDDVKIRIRKANAVLNQLYPIGKNKTPVRTQNCKFPTPMWSLSFYMLAKHGKSLINPKSLHTAVYGVLLM